MSDAVLERIKGVLYGQAVGDALGLGTEFMSKEEVGRYYQFGLTRYGQILQDGHRRRWAKGAWTDDTEQLLCVVDSLLACGEVDVVDIAGRLHRWALTGKGIGQTVGAVLAHPKFLTEPHEAARAIWEASGRKSAANGGVMRTAALGLWDYSDPAKVRQNGEAVCRITHYDPRCVGSCVVVSLAIAAMLRGERDVAVLWAEAERVGREYDERIGEYLARANHSLAALELDEGLDAEKGEWGKIGYTLKAMGAGFWALRYGESYRQAISAIVMEGGDADTNAAVAGAMLGARWGLTGVDSRWAAGLVGGERLASVAEGLWTQLK
ncbi:MAG TPA: ADP-ribosylglycohydrolase family protein [Anaerolineae bacterium]|nr:ADP-ribosylglycohydrolase family protein [Anaerolineae bacterium]